MSGDDKWARVELYRWQHGDLPRKNEKPLSVPEGLRGMAKAIDAGDPASFPTPFNVALVLRYAAKMIEREWPLDL